MSFVLRYIFLAFIFELSVFNAIQASDDTHLIQIGQSIEKLQHQSYVLSPKDLLRDVFPFELIEITELNESNEEESNDLTNCLGLYFNSRLLNAHQRTKTTIRSYNFSFSYFSIPFFVMFHSWKFHL